MITPNTSTATYIYIYICYVFSYTAIHCPEWYNDTESVSSRNTILGCHMTVTCQPGYQFRDGQTMRETECMESGNWSMSESCIGRDSNN